MSVSILEMFGFRKGSGPDQGSAADNDTVRKIAEALDHMNPDDARFLAAFAYILSRAAAADLHVSDQEIAAMEGIVRKWGGLDAERAALVVDIAKSRNTLFGATDNFLVTREFNDIASREQKIGLLHCLFAVTAADHSITTTESNVLRQIADELKLDHRDYADARSAFRDYLEVLKPPGSSDGAG